jgi:hypothetical protein
MALIMPGIASAPVDVGHDAGGSIISALAQEPELDPELATNVDDWLFDTELGPSGNPKHHKAGDGT